MFNLELLAKQTQPSSMMAKNEDKEGTVVLTQVEVYKTQKPVNEKKEVVKPQKEIDVQGNSSSMTFGGFTLENCEVTFNIKN